MILDLDVQNYGLLILCPPNYTRANTGYAADTMQTLIKADALAFLSD